ncbi:nucleotidyl transferase AbiEii/AbiGii toxin family protein [Chitinophaga sp. HK235]|uniref:nucleotidyl transferase AbiEii/AbiGii toxin family protein n=1 Tax=Chitinophaga sp. HK235 TaxID=2952571 RepID=UPI001BAC4FA9|nr:nucleotidyl transferase AbiEii/AbiGii toxin family protein [Chitinophaga sp. HK235]
MSHQLYWNTVNPMLKAILKQLMACEIFNSFRLVGGTSLSLQIGHRISVDIDLFTDSEYASVDFAGIDTYLRNSFSYITDPVTDIIGMGKSYFVGKSEQEAVKLDLYYTDSFIQPVKMVDHIRMATIDEIVAMKMEVVQRFYCSR